MRSASADGIAAEGRGGRAREGGRGREGDGERREGGGRGNGCGGRQACGDALPAVLRAWSPSLRRATTSPERIADVLDGAALGGLVAARRDALDEEVEATADVDVHVGRVGAPHGQDDGLAHRA